MAAENSTNRRFGNGNFRDLGPVNWVITRIGAKVQRRRTLGVFATLGRSGRVFRGWLIYSATHMPLGPLGRRDSELVILRVASQRHCEYELDHHRELATKAGLSPATISAVLNDDHGLTGRDAAILEAVDQVVNKRQLDDAAYNQLLQYCTPKEVTALIMLATHYDGLATTLQVLGTPLDEKLH